MLTDTRARKAKPRDKTYRIADAGGLALEVRPSGSKIWRYRYRLAGKPGMYTIGEYPTYSIADAREARDKAKRHVSDGLSPIEAREQAAAAREADKANTLREIGEEWIESKRAGWSAYYSAQAERMLRADIWPKHGDKPIREVTPAALLPTLRAVEKRAPTVAVNLKQWLGAIFRYAIATLRADSDPTQALAGAIRKPPAKPKASFDLKELQKLSRTLWGHDGKIAYRLTEIAIQMLALTFVRTVELRKAQWPQFDLNSKQPTWTVPRGNMKKSITHIVPLSDQAVELIKELKTLTGGRDYCFPNMRSPNEPMSATTINRVLERQGYGGIFSGHAFRTTASTLLNSYGFDADWIEKQLAHSHGDKVRASYNHAQYIRQRREMMQWWADLVDTLRLLDPTAEPHVPPLPAILNQSTPEARPGASASPTPGDALQGSSLH